MANPGVAVSFDGAVNRAAAVAKPGARASGAADQMGGRAAKVEDSRMANMRSALEERGLFSATVDRILSQWSASSMRLHRLYFENFFVPFCRAFGYDEWVCDSSCLCNCLEFNLQRMEDLAAREKRAPQHGALKKLRAAVSETWKVVFGVRVTFHSDVEMMFKAARLHAPNTRAYSTTWDISIIFDY